MNNKAVVLWGLKSSIITVLMYLYYVKTPEAGKNLKRPALGIPVLEGAPPLFGVLRSIVLNILFWTVTLP